VFFFPMFRGYWIRARDAGCFTRFCNEEVSPFCIGVSERNISKELSAPMLVLGFGVGGVPALLPPPMPFQDFVATAGALQFPRRRFL